EEQGDDEAGCGGERVERQGEIEADRARPRHLPAMKVEVTAVVGQVVEAHALPDDDAQERDGEREAELAQEAFVLRALPSDQGEDDEAEERHEGEHPERRRWLEALNDSGNLEHGRGGERVLAPWGAGAKRPC